MSARGIVQFGPLPDPTQDLAAYTTEIEQRLNRVFRLAQDVQHDLRQEEAARHRGDQQVNSDLRSQLAATEANAKRAGIRGLREQVIGWFFVAVGLVAQGMADLQGASVESRMLEVEQAQINAEAQARLSQLRTQLGLPAPATASTPAPEASPQTAQQPGGGEPAT